MQHGTVAVYPRRPLLVTVLAFLLSIQGILGILIGIFAILDLASVVDTITIRGHTATRATLDIIGYVLGGMSVAIGAITLALAIGLWTLKCWAFWTTLALLTINLIIQVALFFRPHTPHTIEIASLVISALLLLYFLAMPRVRRAFRRR